MTCIEPYRWPLERLGEAIEELARQSRLPLQGRDAPRPEPRLYVAGPDTLDAWIQSAAASMGLEAVTIESSYAEVERFLCSGGPALVRLPGAGEPQFLLLLSGSRRHARLLHPNVTIAEVPIQIVRAALCAEIERPVLAALEKILDVAAVREARRRRSRDAMLYERIRSARVGGCWLLRAPAASNFLAQVARAGAVRHLACLLAASGAEYGLLVLAWWLLGRGAFDGRLYPGWLTAWALLLVTIVPFRLLSTWSAGMLSLQVGAALKQRLLAGALALVPEEIRHQGAGQLLGQIIQSEVVELMGLRGGIMTLIGSVELVLTLAVLAQGAGGLPHVVLLLSWIGLTITLIGASVGAYRCRMALRLAMTHDLVEQMVGHRTRLTQQPQERWHDSEDPTVERHFHQLKKTDRAATILTAVVPRGWLIVGVLGLGPTFVNATASPAAIAVGIGGVLLAYGAFRKLATGAIQVIEVGLTWGQIAPLFRAAARKDLPCSFSASIEGRTNDATGPDAAQVILEAYDLAFRYDDRAKLVLNGCSLTIRNGDRILVDGASGTGKSTLGAILAGLRVPTSGLILLGGLDRDTLGARGWRRRVVVAPQFHENHVLLGTLAFNLLMGRRWPPREEDLIEAEAICRELDLGGLIARMPSRMMQMVGETGWQLSHGERSRLYIARALLHGADLIILDESFAALDPETLRRTLDCVLRRARSLVVIAHP